MFIVAESWRKGKEIRGICYGIRVLFPIAVFGPENTGKPQCEEEVRTSDPPFLKRECGLDSVDTIALTPLQGA